MPRTYDHGVVAGCVLLQRGHHIAVGGNQIVAQIPNLVERKLGCGVWVKGGSVVDVFALAGQCGFNRH